MADEKEISSRLDEIERILKKSPTPRDFIKEMKDDGFGVLTPMGQRALLIIRGRYVGDFRDFFTTLSKHYDKSKRATAEIKRVSGVLSKINSLVELIDKILFSTDPLQARDDGVKLAEMTVDLDNEFEFFSDSTKLTQTLSENIEATANKTKVPLSKIKEAQAVLSRKTQEVTHQPTTTEKVVGGAKTIGKAALAVSTLDLFGGGQAVRESFAKRELRKQRLENIELSSAGTNIGRAAESPTVETEGEDESARISRRAQGSGDLSGALFSFFNTGAYKAKWTSQLLASSGMSPYAEDSGSDSRKGMGLGLGAVGLAALVPQIMKIMGPALAIMFAGQVGWLVGRAVGGIKIGDKTVDKHVEDFATQHIFGGDEQKRLKKAAKQAQKDGINPVTARALEIQAENPEILPGEAVKMAAAELRPEKETEVGSSVPLGEQATSITPYYVPENIRLNEETGEYETTINGQTVTARTPQELEELTTQYSEGVAGGDYSNNFGEEFQKAFDKSLGASQKIPIDTSMAEAQKEQKAGLEKLDKSLNEMSETLKDGAKGSQSKAAGYDANNIRNPLLSSMGAGQLTN